MTLTLAVLWTFALVTDIVSWVRGNPADWVLVFCPLCVLVVDKWIAYFKEQEKYR